MLYVVGDSNSVRTSPFLLEREFDNVSMCKEGWNTEDVLRAVRRKQDLSDATAFFVFVGLNDRLTGEMIASNVLQIIAALKARRPSHRIPIFVALPFCVQDATPKPLCDDRRDAASRISRELREDASGTEVIADHVNRGMYAKKSALTTKPGTHKLDPLHLNATAYKHIANRINERTFMQPPTAKRPHMPNRKYQ